MSYKEQVIIFGIFSNVIYFIGAINAVHMSEWKLFLLYFSQLLVIIVVAVVFSKAMVTRLEGSITHRVPYAFIILFPFTYFILILVLMLILDPIYWLGPGHLKYQNFKFRNGFVFSFVQVLGLVVAYFQTSPFRKLIVLFAFSIPVMLVFGRNPAAMYFLNILVIISSAKASFIGFLILSSISAALVNSARAVGFDFDEVVAHLYKHGVLEYIINSSEFNVGGRTFMALEGTVTSTNVDGMSWTYPFLPILTLFPVSELSSLFLDLRNIARLVSDQYGTTGGMPLIVEGYYLFFGIGAPLYSLVHLTLLGFFLGRASKFIPSQIMLVIMLFVILNSNRIDAITLWNFAYNSTIAAFVMFFPLKYVSKTHSKA